MDRIEALWRRCRAGDPEALEELVRRWERKVFYHVRRRTHRQTQERLLRIEYHLAELRERRTA